MAIVYSPEYNRHQDKFHIENKARTDAIMNNLSKQSFFNKLNIIAPNRADLNQVLSVHTPEHVNFIDEFCKKGGGNIDFDTYATSQSYQTALLSAGGAIKASQLVLNGKIREIGHFLFQDLLDITPHQINPWDFVYLIMWPLQWNI